ncbi:DUF202 domain-containing protein [Comamonas testosteroni]|uniref:DUF202 domain-containing protein n=1 Tax=Comamonas testosteroni TaxID=285 RepID=UPI00389AA07F
MRDAGLQPERTSLAWSRTALSMLVTAAISLKSGFEFHRLEIVTAGACLPIGAVFAWVTGMTRNNEILHTAAVMSPSGSLIAALAVGPLTGCVVATAVLAKNLLSIP